MRWLASFCAAIEEGRPLVRESVPGGKNECAVHEQYTMTSPMMTVMSALGDMLYEAYHVERTEQFSPGRCSPIYCECLYMVALLESVRLRGYMGGLLRSVAEDIPSLDAAGVIVSGMIAGAADILAIMLKGDLLKSMIALRALLNEEQENIPPELDVSVLSECLDANDVPKTAIPRVASCISDVMVFVEKREMQDHD